ncbi:YdeI/OmpD-associated family protein [Salaquimonas pukyongi]|uniref:YdeI/OmpD-associated family protein n=1 Tax=Salaquimonas pukyongi TaxID=2712698 RepID=UPI00096B9CB7|nr:YdeI/OmpD-associated family protein [Salaquimonas pukyongi]
MITEVEDFFDKGCGRCKRFATPDCSARIWADGLKELRRICRSVGLVETVKWGHPCYMAAGRNIALIGAFRGDFRLTFFNAALMKDPEGILERQGENTAHPNMIRLTGAKQVLQCEAAIESCLKEAIGYAEAGILPEREDKTLELPAELVDALDGDPELAGAFCNLTPGRQRSYVINLASAKKPETRIARISKFRDRILAGKGATEY